MARRRTGPHDSERGDALYDIDHDICAALFRPSRPIQQLSGAIGLLDIADVGTRRSAQREAAARRARRLLLAHPVLYYATLDSETAAALRNAELADNLARLTGLVVERRAEGVMLVDPTGRFTDRPFPGRGGAVNRTAGLLLAKVADLPDDPDAGPEVIRMAVPYARDAGMLAELYEDFGAASFTAQWHYDQPGLLDAALRLLDDLRLIKRVPGGALILPAAARYRNITAALPDGTRHDGQGAFRLDFSAEGPA